MLSITIIIINAKFKEFMNVLVVFPKDHNPSEFIVKDFNDLYQKDFNSCKAQLNSIEDIPLIKHLGFKGKTVYVYSSINKQVHEIRESSKSCIYLLAPKRYWDKKYPNKKPANIIDIFYQINSGKLYDPSKVRGAGVWPNDNGGIIINTGDRIIGDADKKYNYIFQGNFPDPEEVEDYDREYWFKLADEVFPKFSLKYKYDPLLLFVCIILGNLSRVIPFRFSTDLQSATSTGKSFILDNILDPFCSKMNSYRKIKNMDSPSRIREALGQYSIVACERKRKHFKEW